MIIPLMTLYGHKSSVHAVAFSPDGKRIVSGSYISAKLWDAATGAELMTLPADDSVLCTVFSPDGAIIAGGHLGGLYYSVEIELFQIEED